MPLRHNKVPEKRAWTDSSDRAWKGWLEATWEPCTILMRRLQLSNQTDSVLNMLKMRIQLHLLWWAFSMLSICLSLVSINLSFPHSLYISIIFLLVCPVNNPSYISASSLKDSPVLGKWQFLPFMPYHATISFENKNNLLLLTWTTHLSLSTI